MKFVLINIFAPILAFITFNQNLKAQVSQSINGLSSNYVESLESDNFGIIWVGTNEGLNALIDQNIYEYESNVSDNTSLLNTQIKDIYITDDNSVIAISDDGLSIFNRTNNSFKQLKTETKPVSIYSDPFTSDIYIGTENSGLIVLNNKFDLVKNYRFDLFDPSTISTNNLSSLTDNRGMYFGENKIWIATNRGINILNRSDSTITRGIVNSQNNLSSSAINGFSSITINSSMIEPRSDYLLIGTDRGLNIYDRDNDRLINQKQFANSDVKNIIKINSKLFALLVNSRLTLLEYNSVSQGFKSTIIETPNNNLNVKKIHKQGDFLLVSGENFVSVYDNEFKVIFEQITEYPVTDVNIRNNFLWIGTQNGLTKHTLKKTLVSRVNEGSEYYSKNEFYEVLLNNGVFSITDIPNKNTYEIEAPEEVLSDDNNKIILKKNYLLAMGNNTLYFYNLDFSFFALIFSYNFEFDWGEVNNIFLTDESFYVSTDNGIHEFESDLDNFSDFSFILAKNSYIYDELLNPNVPPNFTDIEEVDNTLWISSDLKTLSFHQIESLDSLVENKILEETNINAANSLNNIDNLYFAKEINEVYGGTSGRGLYKFDLELNQLVRLTREDGLLSNNISDIYYQDSILFIQSGQGLNLIKDGKIRSLTEEDGLSMTSFNTQSIHKIDSSNNIFISGTDGLFQFNYAELYDEDISNEIKLFRVVGYDKFNNPYPIQINNNEIKIDYQITSLLFDAYIGNHYKSDNNRYYYSINDETYNASVNGNQIIISSLPWYGSSIKIYLIDANGNRSINDIEIVITNTPPIWFSYQAFILYLIILVGVYWIIQKQRVKKAKDNFEKERREKELNEARDLQQSLLPKSTPSTSIFDISTYLQSANEMGGDYYDFIEYENKLYSICGDATGHGVTSGIMVSVTKAGLNGVELESPSNMLSKLNQIVKKVNFGRIRMSLSVVKLEENAIEISSAAMPPYYLYKSKNNQLEEVLIPNLPLGGLSRTKYESNKHDFEIGDILVLMSDGLPELPNESNELLDYEAIYNEIFENIDKSAKQISNALLSLGKKWRTHLDDLPDDITLVVIKKVA